MAVKGAPLGRKVSGAVRASGGAGRLAGSVASRTAVSRRAGGNKKGAQAGLISGAKKAKSLLGAD